MVICTCKACKERKSRDELRCLVEFMDNDMQDLYELERQIADKTLKEIAFENLWLLFRPGTMFVSHHHYNKNNDKMIQAHRVLYVTGGREIINKGKKPVQVKLSRDRDWLSEPDSDDAACDNARSSSSQITPFFIDSFHIDFDGAKLGPKARRYAIPPYVGRRPIASLDVYPISFDTEAEQTMIKLSRRGRRFVDLADGAHKDYFGPAFLDGTKWGLQEVCSIHIFGKIAAFAHILQIG